MALLCARGVAAALWGGGRLPAHEAAAGARRRERAAGELASYVDETLGPTAAAAALAAGRVAGAAAAATAVAAVERLPSRKRGRGFRLRCVDAMQRAVFPERGARSAGRRRPRASNAR
uniref:Uncharacterized protein n=1 Tax=Prasinoderma singulare TaxID=676789 RepID=A0A7S3FDB0_9VIRI